MRERTRGRARARMAAARDTRKRASERAHVWCGLKNFGPRARAHKRQKSRKAADNKSRAYQKQSSGRHQTALRSRARYSLATMAAASARARNYSCHSDDSRPRPVAAAAVAAVAIDDSGSVKTHVLIEMSERAGRARARATIVFFEPPPCVERRRVAAG